MKLLKKLFIPLCLTVAAMAGATACSALEPIESSQDSISISVPDPITYTLNLTADKTTAKRGEEVTLAAYLHSEEAEDELAENAIFSIVEGGAAATLSGNKLTISNTAAANTVIKVKAKIGITDSNIVEIKVDVPLEEVSISAGGVTNVLKGSSVTLTKTITPLGADTSALNWEIVEGNTLATINGDVLVVSDKAPTGATIKVKAVSGDIESDVLSFIVGYPLEALTLTKPETKNILSGGKIDLTVTKTPENATDAVYEWAFVQGADLATFAGDTLIVNQGVATGSIIEVKAVCGEFETESVTFIVGYPLEELKLTADVSTNVPNGESITFTVTKVPENTTNGDFEWKITAEDESYYTFDETTGKLTVTYDAPLNTEITVQAIGAVESDPITIIVGVPLTGLAISSEAPAILTHGESYDITVTGTPEEANTKGVQWVFNNAGWASVKDGKLIVNNSVPHGATLTVKAVSGSVESNELSFQVGIGASSIEVTVLGKKNVDPGASTQLTVSVLPNEATDKSYTWNVVGNGRIVNDYLIVNENAKIGDEIIVTAVTANGKESEPVTITVGVPVTGVSISLAGSANIDPNQSRPINVAISPDDASAQKIEWVFEAGEQYCSIVNNTITINGDAPIGEQISFKATVGGHTSNTILVTVGTPITGITVDPEIASGSKVERGTRFDLNVTLAPAGANAAYTWEFLQGGDWASVKNGKLILSADTPDNTVVELQAVSGDVKSTPISYTVTLTEKEVNAGKYYFVLSGESFTVDKNATSASTLKVELYNYNYEKITDKEFSFTIVEGENFVEVTKNGAVCTFKAIGHGTAYVQVTANGLNISEQVVVTAIVPPTSIILPGVFTERTGFNYNFSMYDHNNSTLAKAEKDALPFVATAGGTNVCTDVVYTFRHSDGTTGDAVATYADGKITFNRTGLITVTASSNSGSRVETTVSYTFNINEGYNVYTFEEAAAIARNGYYNGQILNFVALTKPVAEDGYQYGYEFVPASALKSYPKREDFATNEEYIQAMLPHYNTITQSANSRIVSANRSLYINGNQHVVNASRLPVISQSLQEAAIEKNMHEWLHHGGLISTEPWTADGSDVTGEFFAKIYDVEVKGNSGINYANAENPGAFVGGYMAGINVGTLGRNKNGNEDYSAKYHVDIKNVTSSGFKEGFKLVSVVDGTVENAYAYDCWQNGFSFRSSIIKMKNLKLGACGAVGIELMPEGSNKAGLGNNQPQTVTFEGTFDVEGNRNALNTSYLQTYNIMGYNIPTIVVASLQNAGIAQDATKLSHLQDPLTGEVCMVTFIIDTSILGDVPNVSQALYPSYQAGGIIDAADLPSDGTIDTEHQFIRLPASLAPGMPLGSVLLYNLNYGK